MLYTNYLCILFHIIPHESLSMQLYWLTDNIGVSDQLYTKDISELYQLGIKSIICNRPDFESDYEQPTAESIKLASENLAIKFAFHPVKSNFQSKEDAAEMAKRLLELPKPLVAYCRSGGRSTALIGLTQQLNMIDLGDL